MRLPLALALCATVSCSHARDDAQDREITAIKKQSDEIRKHVEELRRDAQAKAEANAAFLMKTAPEEEPQVEPFVISTLKSNTLIVETLLRRRILDEKGRVVEPEKVLSDLRRVVARRTGGKEDLMRRVLIQNFGTDTGLAILRAGDGKEGG